VSELPEVEQPAKLSSAIARQIILVIVPPGLFSVDESIGALDSVNIARER
jgi:hypothetical protein